MSNFWKRAFTGAAFVAVMIGCIWWSFWSMATLFLLISVLGLWEFYSLLEKANHRPQKFSGICTAVLIFLSYAYYSFTEFHGQLVIMDEHEKLFIVIIMLVGFSSLFIIELFRKTEKAIYNISFTIVGICYVVFPFAFLTLALPFIHDPTLDLQFTIPYVYTPHILLGYFFLIWSNDTFAYLTGRIVGKRKLFERISPKKTWEGFMGGIICTQGLAYVLSIYFTELAPLHWHIIALMVSVFGTLGDLVESMFKRHLEVKDSGNMLPGHGGILDRFDGVLISSPFVVTYLILIS